MKVAVIANGEWDISWGRQELELQAFDLIICADGGGNHALASGRIPDVLIGDLDSITPGNLKICQEKGTVIKKYPREKDQTDLELALDYAEAYLIRHGQQEDVIDLYAAGGKRLDHLLGNIALMLGAAEHNRRIRLIDQSSVAWIRREGREKIQGNPGQGLSIIPLSERAVVTSRGLYYLLNRLTLLQNTTRGISNVLTADEAEIEVHEGKVLLIILQESA